MAKKTTYTATDANGVVHTRTTDSREYTHTVVFKYSFDAAMARADQDDKSDARDFAYYVGVIAKGVRADGRDWEISNDERSIENAKAKIGQCATAEEYIIQERADRVARVNKAQADGFYDAWQNAGWCGRLDLAQKLAAKNGGVILPAVIKA